MLTVIIKRSEEPKVIQLTQEMVMRELSSIHGSEMLLEDSWTEGLKKVRTMFVCLLEADCTLSANYLSSNYGLMLKTMSQTREGGHVRQAMLASCLGIERFDNRIYDYRLNKKELDGIVSWQLEPYREKKNTKPYEAQIGFLPGAIIRYTSIKDVIDTLHWDQKNIIKLSADLSFHFWNTNRTLKVNPNTTYVSTTRWLSKPPFIDIHVPTRTASVFTRYGL